MFTCEDSWKSYEYKITIKYSTICFIYECIFEKKWLKVKYLWAK